MKLLTRLFLGAACVFATPALASSTVALPLGEHYEAADAVFRGTVLGAESFRTAGGHIYTRTTLRVEETLKGKLPGAIQLVHRGGVVDGEGEMDGFSPQFKPGEERLLFASERADGSLFALAGPAGALRLARAGGVGDFILPHRAILQQLRAKAGRGQGRGRDLTGHASAASAVETEDVAVKTASGVSGLLVDGSGMPARFTAPDRGEPIGWLVDADALPAGITLEQALGAVEAAVQAWEAVSTVRFRFEGMESFGTAAPNVTASDGRVRIQLHDTYGHIPDSTVLGIGGRAFTINTIAPAGWGTGGNVGGNEFHRSTRGYVVLKHTRPALQNLVTLTEVLCHEVGHALGLAHSSEDPGETDPLLSEAIMYYRAHGDGRGASLGEYDLPVIRKVHPEFNTPPYSHPRVIDAVTVSSGSLNVPGINEVQLHGYDLQEDGLTLQTANATAMNGSFSINGTLVRYTPVGFIAADRIDPETNNFYDNLVARFSDGVNASPHVRVRVMSFSPDSHGDGLPDNWMIQHFGQASPQAGANRGAHDDFDGDGLTNLQEYLLGSDPTDPNSHLKIISFDGDRLEWEGKAHELYEVHGSADLIEWRPAPVLPTSTPASVSGLSESGQSQQFFRVKRLP